MRVERIGAVAAALLVAGGLVGGFVLIGSPAHQRDLELDRVRSGDLADIAAALQRRFHPSDGVASPLPKTLPGDLLSLSFQRPVGTADPQSHRPYLYTRESATRYRLCATFAAAKPEDGGYGVWPHPAGRYCYELDVGRGAEPISVKNRATLEAS